MLIRSLKLRNIRSYIDQDILFPEGSILLSGDIGSGKTTILLAIEFALFGILKGTIPGTALLRHGKQEGSVELHFSIAGKDVIVHRKLKRGSTVKQEAGYIVIDNTRHDCTVVELKSKILELIGYPDELVSKSKSLIYRYTIYTPQEEMKHILFESADERLDTIRKIFNIDKYKRIKENTINLLREVRSELKILQARIEQLPEIEAKLKDKQTLMKIKTDTLKELDGKLKQAKRQHEELKDQFKEYELQAEEIMRMRRDHEVVMVRKRHAAETLRKEVLELERLAESIASLNSQLKDEHFSPAEDVHAQIVAVEKKLEANQERLDQYRRKEAEFALLLSQAQTNAAKFSSLNTCPLCLQEVRHEHKAGIIAKEEEKAVKLKENLATIAEKREKGGAIVEEEKKLLRELSKKEKELAVFKVKLNQVKELESRKKIIEEEISRNKQIQKDIAEQKSKTALALEKSARFEEEFARVKKAHEKSLEAYHELEVQQVRLKTDVANLADAIDDLVRQHGYFDKVKLKIHHLQDVSNWLDSFFMDLIGVIERQILQAIYREFSSLFQEWFSNLVEDDTIAVRLQEDFTPVIEQNGYETYIENLSGGERTSVALAYRLALFKIINEFMSSIKTKDIIILDEPTDGFSSEQLDKIRDILDMLRTKQTIIVSHEAKLESFVEHVIRIVKEHHVSRVL